MNSRKRSRSVCFVVACFAVAAACRVEAQPPTSLDDVVVLARSRVRLAINASHASGQIVVNDPGGVAIADPRFRTVPDLAPQLIADNVEIVRFPFASGPIFFDVFANNVFDPNNKMVVNGTLTQPIGVPLPLFPYPPPPVVVPGAGKLHIQRSESPVTLPAGDYGDVRVFAYGVLALEGGTYNFNSLKVGSRGKLLANGTSTINVKGRVRFAGRSVFGPTDPQMNGRCITLNSAGTKVIFGLVSDVTAIVSAPSAQMRLTRLGTYRGNFTADRVTVGRGTVLQALPPLTEACP